jgi:opacity protein-like surface antigen
MGSWKRIAIVVMLAGMPISLARAGDMPSIPPLSELARTMPAPVAEFASGWYLRGDAGYRINDIGSATSTITAPDPTNSALGDSSVVGIGFGFKTSWFRTDVTADYGYKAKYTGTIASANDVRTSIDSITVLGNAYFDLGTWSGFTPYVGAGAGGSYIWTRGLVSPAIAPGTPIVGDGIKWNLAWAAMAGVSYRMSPRLLIDVGYRYLNLGDATSGEDNITNAILFNDLTSQEIRLGLRYLID